MLGCSLRPELSQPEFQSDSDSDSDSDRTGQNSARWGEKRRDSVGLEPVSASMRGTFSCDGGVRRQGAPLL